MRAIRPYVICPPGWPERARARSFATLEAAERAARQIANQTGMDVAIYRRSRFGGDYRSGEALRGVRPVHKRDADLRADVDMAHGIGLEF